MRESFTGAWQNNFDVVVYLLLGLLTVFCMPVLQLVSDGSKWGVKSALI